MKLQSVQDFCQEFGFSRASVYRLIRSRRIPVIRTGPQLTRFKLDPMKVLAALEQPAEVGVVDKGAA